MSPPKKDDIDGRVHFSRDRVTVSNTPSKLARTTTHLSRLLTWAMALLTIFVLVLTVSYFRQGGQINRLVNRTADQQATITDLSGRLDNDAKIVSQIRDVALLFAQFGNPNVDQNELRRQLNDLATQLQQEQQQNERKSTTTTTTKGSAASSTTTTTARPTPPPSTTTTTTPALCLPGVVCLRRPLAMARRRFRFGW